ncbi:MAG: sensor histidine kinase [Chitinophagales bacterium]|nr:sensor histidine kinase [Chitinophagales bacterium]
MENSASLFLRQYKYHLQKPAVLRVLMHVGFWLFWLFRTFYDIISLYGWGPGELLFMLVYAATQIPMMYFHLYVLVPQLLNKRRYVIYAVCTVALVFAYSYVNFQLLTLIPDAISSDGLHDYISQLNSRYDIIEGFFTLVITYSIKYAGQVRSTQTRLLQLQRDNLTLELNALKAQINPHFLFNTLNNIYSLALQRSDKTADMVLRLSDMMRYVLYECNTGAVLLEREIEFVSNYVELERIRHGKHVSVRYTQTGDAGEKHIEPLLLIPIVENSFKHGINAQMASGFVEIDLDVQDDGLTLRVVNSVPRGDSMMREKGGIGLENVRKRLELIYPGKHLMDIQSLTDSYQVTLQLKFS